MDKKYSGMTVNERLYVSGLMDEFDRAINEKNITRIVSILEEVEITDKTLINSILRELNLREEN